MLTIELFFSILWYWKFGAFSKKLVKFLLEKKNPNAFLKKKQQQKIPFKKKTLSQMNSPFNNLKLHSILNFKWQKMELSKFFTNLKLHFNFGHRERKGEKFTKIQLTQTFWLELGWKVVNVVTKAWYTYWFHELFKLLVSFIVHTPSQCWAVVRNKEKTSAGQFESPILREECPVPDLRSNLFLILVLWVPIWPRVN